MTDGTEIEFTEMTERVKAALAGAASATGATMLPTETAEEIIGIVYERNFMRSLFPAMPMSRRIMKVPKLTGSVSFHQQTLSATESGTASSESRHSTGEIELELKTMIANIPIGNYLIAYGVEGLLAVLRDDIASQLASNEQSLLINGDTETGTAYADNINGAYHASNNPTFGVDATHNDYLLLFDGLRSATLKSGRGGATEAVAGTFALANIRSAINKLGVYSDNRDELGLIVPRNLEVQLLGLTELQTVDKYGANATILSGELGRIYGIRVFSVGVIAENLDVTGKYSLAGGAVQNTTTAILMNIRSPIIGNPTLGERRFSIGFHDEPTKDRFVLIPKQDIAFAVRYDEAVCVFTGIAVV
tara:strand:+ start:6511 stop:7596 length:1086 start_codon:yes stop_codon:yes gene_type:complete